MSIATELSRIQTDRNTIRTKLVALGLVYAEYGSNFELYPYQWPNTILVY